MNEATRKLAASFVASIFSQEGALEEVLRSGPKPRKRKPSGKNRDKAKAARKQRQRNKP